MSSTRRRRHRAQRRSSIVPQVPASRSGFRAETSALVVTVILGAGLLFFRLGHYALWDDEAGTALNAKSILATGDTSARVDDHNIFAYRGGAELRGLKNRYVPPLAAAVTAGAFWLTGRTDALTARAPFAAMGLGTIVLLFWALRRVQAGPIAAWTLAAAVLGSVSFFLFSRQSRYYAAVMLLSVVIALVHVHGRTVRAAGLLAVLSILLFAASYLNYFALYIALAVDYCRWRRYDHTLSARAWAVLLAPQAIICGAIAAVWNPLRTSSASRLDMSAVAEKIGLFVRLWGEMSQNELICTGLIAFAVVLVWRRRDRPLSRGLTALVVYVAVVAVLTPRWGDNPLPAETRYLVPLIPLGMLLTVRTTTLVAERRPWMGAALVFIACGSNLLHGGPLSARGLRSTIVDYVGKLRDPPGDPFRVAAGWIQRHVRAGESIAVQPDYMMYPLMFHAPHALYAWQLPPDARGQFGELPAIHFIGRAEPTYLLAFGPAVGIWNELDSTRRALQTRDHTRLFLEGSPPA